jgi:hypothetical protein
VVDGWLGGMIGAELWYPLWNPDQLQSAVTGIASKIGNCAKISERSSLAFQSPPSLKSPSSSVVSPVVPISSKREMVRNVCQMKADEDADFIAAFECLQKERSLNPDFFLLFLQNFALSDSDDLKYVEVSVIMTLSSLLKPRFRDVFLKSLKL